MYLCTTKSFVACLETSVARLATAIASLGMYISSLATEIMLRLRYIYLPIKK